MLIKFQDILQTYDFAPKGVIHVGAHWGEEAKDYFDFGVKKTIWVEADSDHYAHLVNHVKSIGFEENRFIMACLSDCCEKRTFKISNNEGQSSSILELKHHSIAHPEVVFVDEKVVETTTLDILLKDTEDLSDYTFLNADIQGAELLMLKGAKNVLNNFNCIYLEVNKLELYEGCALIEDIDTYLNEFGFTRKETEWCGNFGWGDAVYIKK